MCRSFISPGQPALTDGPISTEGGGGSAMAAKRLAQHLALLHEVIRSRRWSAFDSIVLSKHGVFRMICDAISSETHAGFEGSTLMHACLRYDPPLAIVAKIMKMTPPSDRTAALRARDCLGRTPLHVATAHGADPKTIKMLGSVDPSTCSLLDDGGRSPLHLVCGGSSCSEGTVRALLSTSLHPVLLEDEDGMSALEYAIVSDASLEVVNLLQKAAMHLHQEKERQQRSTKKRSIPDECDDADSTRKQRRRGTILSV
eukprot:CAMPEP_0181115656 /NCGR_PEP_ID=MMETSP1071-20121207/21544_1 /TAXON_ID=35127 /ORGANISM="Thalassiosira sp., Strain NH16" /LENGTH=256 /DNA_ID=CAMNT_0023199869 /DNA_START=25 /DNA_END=795 /DNA_ORIENTATION=-